MSGGARLARNRPKAGKTRPEILFWMGALLQRQR